MNLRDCWSSIFWLVVSVLVSIEGVGMGIGTFQVPGPGFLPFWSALFVSALSLILLTVSIAKRNVREKPERFRMGPEWRKVILVASSLFVYGLVLPKIGFLITTFGLMLLFFSIIERSHLLIRTTSALVTVLVTYVAFSHWLGVPLPKGIFSF